LLPPERARNPIETVAIVAIPALSDLDDCFCSPRTRMRAAEWVAKAARLPVPCGCIGSQRADSVVQRHALN